MLIKCLQKDWAIDKPVEYFLSDLYGRAWLIVGGVTPGEVVPISIKLRASYEEQASEKLCIKSCFRLQPCLRSYDVDIQTNSLLPNLPLVMVFQQWKP